MGKSNKDQLALDFEPPSIMKTQKLITRKIIVDSIKKTSKYISSLLF